METYDSNSKEPFGCYIYDDVMSKSIPNGYSVTKELLYELNNDTSKTLRSILVLSNEINLSANDTKAYLSLAEKGNNVMIVSNSGRIFSLDKNENLVDSLSTNFNPEERFFVENLKKDIKSKYIFTNDTAIWKGDRKRYDTENYIMYRGLMGSFISVYDNYKYDVLLYNYEWDVDYSEEDNPSKLNGIPLLIRRKYGKGYIYYCSTPLLFTNYGVLNYDMNNLMMRMMSQISNHPIVKTTAYTGADDYDDAYRSLFDELFKEMPLFKAFLLATLEMLLVMFFMARRRQRIIPVVDAPKNRSLEFVKMIGTLYYQHHDNIDLVKKKYTYFAEEIRHRTGIDIEDVEENENIFRRLSENTGIDKIKIEKYIRDLRVIYNYTYNISNTDMRMYINIMNKILKEL